MIEDYTLPTGFGHPPVVYFLRDYFRGFIKIGTSGQFPQRLTALRGQYGRSLVCLGVHPGAYESEARLHRRFRHLRQYGEWFAPQRELLEYIATKTVSFEQYCRGLIVREWAGDEDASPEEIEAFLDAMARGEKLVSTPPTYQVMLGSWERIWWAHVFNGEIDAIAMPAPGDAFRYEYRESLVNIKSIRGS